MWRATLKGILAHKLRLALTALAIVLGVGMVSGTYILTDTLNHAFDNLFSEANAGVAVAVSADAKFEAVGPGGTDAGSGERIPESLLPKVRAVPGVRAANGLVQGYAQLVDLDGEAIETGGAPTLGFSWTADPELNPLVLRSGRAPRGPGEIVVDAATAEEHDLRAGDTVTVLLQGPPLRGRIVGTVGFGSSDNLLGATLVAMALPEAQRAFDAVGELDAIEVAAEEGVSPTVLRQRIQVVLPKGVQAKTGTQEAQDSASDIKDQLGFFNVLLLVFAGVALFVGAFLIFNTFSILVAQRTRELAMLRALGATPGQVRRSVMVEGIVVGLVASAVGLGVGFLLALGLRAAFGAIGVDLPTTTLQFLPRTAVVALLVGVLTTWVSSVVPAYRASRVPPVAAMRETGPTESVPSARRKAFGWLVGAAGLVVLAAGVVWRVELVSVNVLLVLGAIGVIIGASLVSTLLAGGLLVVAGLVGLLLGLFAGGGILAVGVGVGGIFLGVSILSPLLVRPVAGSIGVPLERFAGVSGKLGRENTLRNPRRTAATASALMIGLALVGFVGVFAQSIKTSTNRILEETLRADYIVSTSQGQGFSQAVAARLRRDGAFGAVSEFRQGVFGADGGTKFLAAVDPRTLPLVTRVAMESGSLGALGRGQMLVSEGEAETAGIEMGDEVKARFARTGARTFRVGGVFATNQLLGSYLISLDEYDRNYTEHLDTFVLATRAPGVSAEAAQKALDEAKKEFPNVRLEDQAQFRESFSDQINQILGLVFMLLFLSLVIAFVGIVNTLVLSVFERTREIGLLRAVGMSRRQVRAMVRWEGVVIVVFGSLIGLAIGVFFGWAMTSALRDQGIVAFAVPAGQLVAFLVVAALLGVVASVWPARRAAKLDVLRAVTVE